MYLSSAMPLLRSSCHCWDLGPCHQQLGLLSSLLSVFLPSPVASTLQSVLHSDISARFQKHTTHGYSHCFANSLVILHNPQDRSSGLGLSKGCIDVCQQTQWCLLLMWKHFKRQKALGGVYLLFPSLTCSYSHVSLNEGGMFWEMHHCMNASSSLCEHCGVHLHRSRWHSLLHTWALWY